MHSDDARLNYGPFHLVLDGAARTVYTAYPTADGGEERRNAQRFPSWEAALAAFLRRAGELGLAGCLPIGGEVGALVLAAARLELRAPESALD
ncbi:MAG TPA: hypothetical protein EYP09_06865 [Anaerolineae bacterium]|nr:hypothetical protein [Anaerolineae bacterium]